MSVYTSVSCPFCGLCCDDLRVSALNGEVRLRGNGCERARESLAGAEQHAKAMLRGKPVSLAVALRKAASLLAGARAPFYGGLASDIEGVKVFLHLADQTGGMVDHAHTESYFRTARVIQSEGGVTTTISEIRNRADVIIMAGTDGVTTAPLFFARCVWAKASLFRLKVQDRKVIYFGRGLNTKPGISPDGRLPLCVPAPPDRLAEAFSALLALYEGRTIGAKTIAGVDKTILEDVVSLIRGATYGVIVWSGSDLNHPHAHHIVESIMLLIKRLNLEQRFAGFSLSGKDNLLGATQVATWQTGYPLRVSFATGVPRHDDEAYVAKRVLAEGESDCLIWVSAFDPDLLPPPHPGIPLILFGRPGSRLATKADVYLPVGIPGIDHAGSFTRSDSVATLPLRKLRESTLPSTAEMALALDAALQTARKEM